MRNKITFKRKPNTKEEVDKILNPVVKKWFYSRFKEYSLPQLFGVSEINSRNNVLISAPTGATKTLTAFLSIINNLVDLANKGLLEDITYCVYVSPLKALNEDIRVNLLKPLEEINAIAGRDLGIRVAVRTGDTSTSERSSMLRKPPHILITTPESLAIVLSTIKFKETLRNVQWLIIDEIHALADNKRGTHLSLSVERLRRLANDFCTVGLSATVAPLEEVAKFLVGYDNDEPRRCRIIDVQFVKKMDLRVLSPVPDLINTTHEAMQEAMYELIDGLIQEHRTTLIFTNTRSATERVVNHLKERFPGRYDENIGAHHGSLSKSVRHNIEERLRKGELKVVVSSTSLELGIDIGYIDLVILLGSPKSVARALQRVGRSGHRLHDVTKGRIIVLDRDDLVENAVLLKSAVERKIDRIHIPTNATDVLAQHIFGIAINERIHIDELYSMIRNSYSYHTLDRAVFMELINYLAGRFASLEERNIYAKIWYDEETGMIGRRGRLARMLYMTNIGTIPDESFIEVKIGSQPIGKIDEAFLERLKRGDVFVLGGEKYEFLYSRGMTAQVKASVYKPPTIPSWISEMLPLSFDLAMEIGRFRRLINEHLESEPEEDVLNFINEYLYLDENSARAIYNYFREQYDYSLIPHDRRIVIENYYDDKAHYYIFHTLFGRRVNDVLSRAIAYILSRIHNMDIEMAITDNGFYVSSLKKLQVERAMKILRADKLEMLLRLALERTEVLRRRFRHCATRALMILRNYKGRSKRVGRQQVSSQILYNALKRINPDFAIIKEARREVLEDLMDIKNAELVVRMIEEKKMEVKFTSLTIPSPFSFGILLSGKSDILKIEDRIEFLKRMQAMILQKIQLDKARRK